MARDRGPRRGTGTRPGDGDGAPRRQGLRRRAPPPVAGGALHPAPRRRARRRGPPMTGTWTIARLTIREASRRKLLLALLALTAVVIALTVFGTSRRAANGTKTLTPLEVRADTAQLRILDFFMCS